jgi:uridine kinase
MTLAQLVAGMAGLVPSCGRSRVIAVDGHAGAGKTTLAGRLAAALGGCPVVHTDDLATHEEPFDWADRLAAQVLAPLRAGRDAAHEVYDWHARRFDGEHRVPAAPYVLLEGVGTGRAVLRPHLTLVLWLEVGPAEAHRRGLRRDGPELTAFWTGWSSAEDAHFAADPTRPYADLLVRQDQGSDGGYRFAPGPAAQPGRHPARGHGM